MDCPAYNHLNAPDSPCFGRAHTVNETTLTTQVHEWQSYGQTVLDRYGSDVRRLEKELFCARQRAAYAEHILLGSTFLLRPIARLPWELWDDIFQKVGTPTTALLLVCRHWNHILTSTKTSSVWNPVELKTLGDQQRPTALTELAVNDFYHKEYNVVEDIQTQVTGARRLLATVALPWVEHLSIRGFPQFTTWTLGMDPIALVSHIPSDDLKMDWRLPACPQRLTFISVIMPETHFRLPWPCVESYGEAATIRLDGKTLAPHLRSLTRLGSLSLAGVFLPTSGSTVTLPRLSEFNYVVPWGLPSFMDDDGVFDGLECPFLKTLRLTGGYYGTVELVKITGLLGGRDFLGRAQSLMSLELTLEIPFAAEILLGHIRACQTTIEHVNICVGHLTLWKEPTILLGALSDTTFAPELKTLRLPETLGHDYSDQWSEASEGIACIESMARARFVDGFQLLDLRRGGRTSIPSSWKHWRDACGWDDLPYIPGGKRRWLFSDAVRAHIQSLSKEMRWNILVETPVEPQSEEESESDSEPGEID
ncbi:hypothetical protein B0H12DRAFT_1072104 [Mycena haematopus]|nr:hypothetical protein B0H12DRAFT_1072104 [Mycena haematopus]